MLEKALQRRIMGRFATGVTVVTTRYGSGDQIWGMTANSLTSLSLEPPLVLITVDRRNAIYEFLMRARCFALNILTKDQEAISRRFAVRGPKDFSDLQYTEAETGSPILDGVLAYVDCRIVEFIPGGDHDIVVGEVVASGLGNYGQPLLFYNGRYTRVAVSGASLETGPETLDDDAFEHYGCF
jgi:flavin reductase (DIM6/NTAB) family NADH-FMN oxidoreductase RutF